MADFYADPSLGGDGSHTTDDADPTTGLKAGGHRTRFVAALVQMVAMLTWFVGYVNTTLATMAGHVASTAANAAASLGGASTTGTSTTSVSMVASGAFTVTTQTGKAFVVGQKVSAVRTSAPTTVAGYGTITAYNSGTGSITINIEQSTGAAGPFTDWTIGLSGYGVPSGRNVNTSGLATGGGNLSADRTINVPSATAADIRTGTDTTKAMTVGNAYSALAPVALADSASITPDFGAGVDFTLTKAVNGALNNPTNCKTGQRFQIDVTQDATGGRTMSFGSAWKREGGALALSTAANAVDTIVGVVKAHSAGVATRIVYDIIRNPT